MMMIDHLGGGNPDPPSFVRTPNNHHHEKAYVFSSDRRSPNATSSFPFIKRAIPFFSKVSKQVVQQRGFEFHSKLTVA